MPEEPAGAAPARDPRRRYCPACSTDITSACRWFALPLGRTVLTVTVIPEECPECHHLLRPPPSSVELPGRRQ